MILWAEIPMVLPSIANIREHWSKRAKRTKAQRESVVLALKNYALRPAVNNCWKELLCSSGLTVTLVRQSPRKLDGDNLQMALKASRDAVASILGVDDGDASVEWRYEQAAGPAALRVRISRRHIERPLWLVLP